MDYFFLDAVSWEHSQALYHAAAHLGREALLVLRPATPYVCLGFHQDAQAEIDLEYCHQAGIPVFRREVGGGAVYLDGQQLFFQLILRRAHRDVPADVETFYRKFLGPVVETYQDLGVPARYRPVNDIIAAGGTKISGTGAAEIEGMNVLVGNFIIDFDYETMARCLRVPDEKFRDKVHKTIYENLTTIKRETGRTPASAEIAAILRRRYEPLLGPLVPGQLDAELVSSADELFATMHTPEWLFANDRRQPEVAQIKIAEGIYVVQQALKAPGGLVRATAVIRHGQLGDVHLAGDFFLFPSSCLPDLERALNGVEASRAAVAEAVDRFYRQRAVESPGLTPEHLAQLLAPE